MAIEKNIEVDYGTSYGKYHRISRVEVNYDNKQMDVYLRHYANSNYREEEKNEFISIKEDIKRIKELEGKEELTKEEEEEKANLVNVKFQESRTVKNRNLNIEDTKYTFNIEEDSEITRDKIYEKIMNMEEYKKAKEA